MTWAPVDVNPPPLHAAASSHSKILRDPLGRAQASSVATLLLHILVWCDVIFCWSRGLLTNCIKWFPFADITQRAHTIKPLCKKIYLFMCYETLYWLSLGLTCPQFNLRHVSTIQTNLARHVSFYKCPHMPNCLTIEITSGCNNGQWQGVQLALLSAGADCYS